MKDGQRAARITAPERCGGHRAKSRPILDKSLVRERTRSSMPAGAKFFNTENLLCHPPERDVLGGKEDAYDVEAIDIAESRMNSVKTRPQRAGIWRAGFDLLGGTALVAAPRHSFVPLGGI